MTEPQESPEWQIRYEVALLGQYTEFFATLNQQGWGQFPGGSVQCLTYTAQLEALLGHARVVIEFLSNGQSGKQYRAVDFATSWKPAEAAAVLGDLEKRINNALSHLSRERPGPVYWNVCEEASAVVAEYQRFLESPDLTGDVAMLCDGAAIARPAIERARTGGGCEHNAS